MTWTLKVDADQLDGTPWPAAFFIKPVANVDGKLAPVTITDADGVVMNPRENPFPLTEGVRDISLPSEDYPTIQPEFFGFQVRIGNGKWITVPAQDDGSEHNLSEFIENVATIPLLPADQAVLAGVVSGLAAELVARAAGDATLTAAVAAEATTRGAADTTLATSITAEATARANADTALTAAVGLKADATALTAETAARIAADALKADQATTYTKTQVDALDAAQYKALAREPGLLVTGTVTRDSNGAATSAPVTWPDGSPGTYAATTVSTAFPGAVDAYTITYGSPVTRTYTQAAVTRDANGAVTNPPAITVA